MDHANVELQTTVLSKLLAAFPTLVILYLLVRDAHVLLHVLRVFKRLVTLVAAVPDITMSLFHMGTKTGHAAHNSRTMLTMIHLQRVYFPAGPLLVSTQIVLVSKRFLTLLTLVTRTAVL